MGSRWVAGGVRKGDVPDWIARDSHSGSYVLAEAKGRLTGNEWIFLWAKPACVKSGTVQFDRVAVRDASNRRIRTTNRVVANLWCTDRRQRCPVSLLWDPEGEAEGLSEEEIPRHASAIRSRRVGNITAGLGHPGFLDGGPETSRQTVRITAQPTEVPQPLDDERLLVETRGEPRTATRRSAEPLSGEKHERRICRCNHHALRRPSQFSTRPTLTPPAPRRSGREPRTNRP